MLSQRVGGPSFVSVMYLHARIWKSFWYSYSSTGTGIGGTGTTGTGSTVLPYPRTEVLILLSDRCLALPP